MLIPSETPSSTDEGVRLEAQAIIESDIRTNKKYFIRSPTVSNLKIIISQFQMNAHKVIFVRYIVRLR